MNDVLKKVKEWLEGEQDAYNEIKNDIGDVDSFDDGICEGRNECATSLLKQIKKWENENSFLFGNHALVNNICKKKYGHSNWVIISTLSDQEKVGLDEVAEIQTVEGVQVAFYYEARGKYDE